MSDMRSGSHRRAAAIVVICLLSQLYGLFCLRVLLARLGGASIAEALRAALCFRAPADWAYVVVAASAVVGSVGFLFIRRGAGRHGTAPGAVIWRRLRLVAVIGALLAVAAVALFLAAGLAGGGIGGWEWMCLLPIGLMAAVVLLVYGRKPTPEYLHALGTGDLSRLQDERAQRVGGAAAATTLTVALPILFFGGTLYEVLFRGEWPIRTGLEVVIILLVWSLASWHWNRAL
jgi:hypothetical protein